MDNQTYCTRGIYCNVPSLKEAAPYLLLFGFIAYVFNRLAWATGCALNLEAGSAIAVTILGLAALAAASWALIKATDFLCALATR